ncbi:hypothetical protein SeMB42_g01533 [Synchytrium endobioticum]|uniref:Ribonuclease n=1 Tax=Synchytrium endobioticum TaxID=286115 RepID=A0A507DN22_9FUNG|nr:hypothetical protein SeMB42_g01523 [Synchytrium endobioticum]TPX52278.1 hypothetical protein SeMB42_g01527 [Synchytrium endobioticum]TPX52286.1 hypothetical protein SeMB42_g01530 [Synchytrium endobioticum]TPX52287.1 hypothetical protein SeMB42_g01533 [Synchytrium endobioticum]
MPRPDQRPPATPEAPAPTSQRQAHAHIPTQAVIASFTHHADVPSACTAEDVVLGVDEAGRPMVYAVCYVPVARKDELRMSGVADSKTLDEEQRDALFDALARTAWAGWAVHACSPHDISEAMLRRTKYNLNALAHDTTVKLIQETMHRGVRVAEIYVDTVGPTDTYQAKLCALFPGVSVTVAKKADSLYPVVSAASICAKVTRDAMLRGWIFAEKGLHTLSREFGSGYPSDPNTTRWLRENMDPIFGFPGLIRFSWSTTANMLEQDATHVEWPIDKDEDDQTEISSFFVKAPPATRSRGGKKNQQIPEVVVHKIQTTRPADRDRFFKEMRAVHCLRL